MTDVIMSRAVATLEATLPIFMPILSSNHTAYDGYTTRSTRRGDACGLRISRDVRFGLLVLELAPTTRPRDRTLHPRKRDRVDAACIRRVS